MSGAAHQPFGQIPTYEEGDLALFETGAILLHIAQRHGGGTRSADGSSTSTASARTMRRLTSVTTTRVPLCSRM